MKKLLPREIESFWTLLTAPAIWAGHFLACYVLTALHCEKPALLGISFQSLRLIILAITIVALLGVIASAWLAWRQWGFGVERPPHDDPTSDDRKQFQGFATLLLSGLSFVAILFVAAPALFITECVR
ncbi:hypothetical protein ACSVBT_19765 [Afipia sp. TerB]